MRWRKPKPLPPLALISQAELDAELERRERQRFSESFRDPVDMTFTIYPNAGSIHHLSTTIIISPNGTWKYK